MPKKKTKKVESDLVAKLRARMKGKADFMTADEIAPTYSLRRPFGIPSLDISLRGGMPAGTVAQFYGKDGSGKNYLANCAIREVQKNYGDDTKVFILSFGYEIDKTAMLMAGVHLPYTKDIEEAGIAKDDPRYAHLFKPKGEIVILKTGTDKRSKSHPAETMMEAVLACVETGEFQLGIVDEMPAAMTAHQRGLDDFGDPNKPGGLASLLSDFQRNYHLAMEEVPNNETSLVIINQMRANIGPSRKTTTQGLGWALRHLKAVDIHLTPIGQLKVGEEVIGKKVAYLVDKGKCGLSEGGKGEYNFLWYHGADIHFDIIQLGSDLGIVEKRGSYFYFSVPHEETVQQVQGLKQFRAYCDEYEGTLEHLYDLIIQKAGLSKVRYR